MIKVEIWTDLMCPYAYIGNRHLEIAIEQYRGKEQIEVLHKAFELAPGYRTEVAPPNPIDHISQEENIPKETLTRSFDELKQKAEEVGLPMNIGSAKVVNSSDALRLIHYAAGFGKAKEMKSLLFTSHFGSGKNLAVHEVLADLAEEAGLDRADVLRFLSTEEFRDVIARESEEGLEKGLEVIPYIIINDEHKFSNIAPVDNILEIFNKIG